MINYSKTSSLSVKNNKYNKFYERKLVKYTVQLTFWCCNINFNILFSKIFK